MIEESAVGENRVRRRKANEGDEGARREGRKERDWGRDDGGWVKARKDGEGGWED